jgi:hypothetical protein
MNMIRDILMPAFDTTKNRYSDSKPLFSKRHPVFVDGVELKGAELRYFDKMRPLAYGYFGLTRNEDENYCDTPSGQVFGMAHAYLDELVRFRRYILQSKLTEKKK